MNHKDYFKLQSKNLLKDYKTRYSYYDEEASATLYQYKPKFFDIEQIFIDLGIDDDKEDFKFTLMNSQHIIANLAGFKKWNELEKACDSELELAHLNFDNVHKQYRMNLQTGLYYELDETEKLNAIKEHKESGFADYAPDDIVECLHCGSRYKFCEVKAIRSKEPYREEDDFDAIVCKNYPKCDGTIIDLIKVEEIHTRNEEGR